MPSKKKKKKKKEQRSTSRTTRPPRTRPSAPRTSSTSTLRVEPLTAARFADLEALFGPRGACGGCWCMFPRVDKATFERNKSGGGAKNRAALRALVDGGQPIGVIGYLDGRPAAWAAISPKQELVRLGRSRVCAPVDGGDDDDAQVWSIPCLFVHAAHRKRGLSAAMIDAACAYAARCGARVVEAYPIDARQALPAAFAWWGLRSSFDAAGFVEVVRRSATRSVVRRALSPSRS